MNIRINSVRFNATSRLESFVNSKVKKLAQYYEGIIGAEVFLRVDNNQTEENKITEIKIELPGNELFAKKQSKSFEESTDSACDALRRQITKHKGKVRGV
ncbi:MAG: ribosome hibernation-promoting factor, HPF/YfiA family [Bacteroidota bacterium]